MPGGAVEKAPLAEEKPALAGIALRADERPGITGIPSPLPGGRTSSPCDPDLATVEAEVNAAAAGVIEKAPAKRFTPRFGRLAAKRLA